MGTRPLRVLISCAEPSGDLYAGALAAELQRCEPGVEIVGLGGPRLRAAGARLVGDFSALAVTGITGALRVVPRSIAMLRRLAAEARAHRPDVVVLVDAPDFNFPLMWMLRRLGIPMVYYISPQLWAWRRGRIKTMKQRAARVLVIFPFEEAIYREAGVPVEFVGHPLVDLAAASETREAFLRKHGLDPTAPTVALLPGSRRNELHRIAPAMAAALPLIRARVPGVQFVIAGAPGLPDSLFAPLLDGPPEGGPYADGSSEGGPYTDGPPEAEASNGGPPEGGPYTDGPPEAEASNGGPPKGGPYMDGPPEGEVSNGGPPKGGPYMDGPPESGPSTDERNVGAAFRRPVPMRPVPVRRPVLIRERTNDVLNACDVVITASGTATVQCVLHERPMVVVYRVSGFDYWLAKRFVTLKDVAMPNVLAGRRVVPELIQLDLTPERIAAETTALLLDRAHYGAVSLELRRLREQLGTSGATARAAEAIRRVARG